MKNPCKDVKLPYQDLIYHLFNYIWTKDKKELEAFNTKVRKN